MTTVPPVPPVPTVPLVGQPSDPYPVLVTFAERAKQRRWTVLLRLFMAIPLLFVVAIFSIANFVLVIIGWFGALFIGRTPKFTRDLTTITLRLALRLYAYTALLSDHFPSFALEERADDTVRMAVPEATKMNRAAVFFRLILVVPAYFLSAFVQAGLLVFHIFGWFATLTTGWLPSPLYDVYRVAIRYQIRLTAYLYLLVPTYPGKLFGDPIPPVAAPVDPPPAPKPTMHPSWALVLGRGGKRVLVIAIILGIPEYGAYTIGQINRSQQTINDQQLVQANNRLVGQIAQFASRGRACQTATDVMACVEANDSLLAGKLDSFADTLANNANTDISSTVVRHAQSAATHLADLFHSVADAGSNKAAFNKAANTAELNRAAANVQSALTDLQAALNNR